jgi:hypothetical protein
MFIQPSDGCVAILRIEVKTEEIFHLRRHCIDLCYLNSTQQEVLCFIAPVEQKRKTTQKIVLRALNLLFEHSGMKHKVTTYEPEHIVLHL